MADLSRTRRRYDRDDLFGDLIRDIRQSLRGIRRSPVFASNLILSLGFGVGLTGAVFSVLDRLVLRAPTGVYDAATVHRVTIMVPATRSTNEIVDGVSPADLEDFRTALGQSGTIAGYRLRVTSDRDSAGAPLSLALTTPGFFQLLGIRPMLGRFYSSDDDRAAASNPVAVVSASYWKTHFGGDRTSIDRHVLVDSVAFKIIGVAQSGFDGIDADVTDMWIPVGALDALNSATRATHTGDTTHDAPAAYRHIPLLVPIVRVASSESVVRVASLLTVAYRRSSPPDRPADNSATLAATPLVQVRGSDQGGHVDSRHLDLALLAAIVSLVALLITLANSATLLLLRSLQRSYEIGVRVVLGVSRGRLIRQLLTETLLLGLGAAVIATAISQWGGILLRNAILPDIHWGPQAIEGRTVAFVLGLCVCCGLLAGLVPALLSTRPNLLVLLKHSGMASSGAQRRTRTMLIATQVCLCTALVVGCGVIAGAAGKTLSVDLGFDDSHVATVETVNLTDGVAASLMPMIRDRIVRFPGVIAVSVAGGGILRPNLGTFALRMSNNDTVPNDLARETTWNIVDQGFFSTTKIPILRGRAFTEADDGSAMPVVIVNQSMASRYWPRANPIGLCFYLFRDRPPCVTIIGVAGDTRTGIAGRPPIRFYVPLDQSPSRYYMPAGYSTYRGRVIVVRMRNAPASRQLGAMAEAARSIVGAQGLVRVTTPRGQLSAQIGPLMASAVLLSCLAVLALVLAGIGVYGSVSYEVSRRANEFAVKIALGATPWDTVRTVLFFGLRVVLAGALAGLGLALVATKLASSRLLNIDFVGVGVLTEAFCVVLTAALAASLIPAWRASRIDAVGMLKEQ
jgi:putative ABC transport system permease protein